MDIKKPEKYEDDRDFLCYVVYVHKTDRKGNYGQSSLDHETERVVGKPHP